MNRILKRLISIVLVVSLTMLSGCSMEVKGPGQEDTITGGDNANQIDADTEKETTGAPTSKPTAIPTPTAEPAPTTAPAATYIDSLEGYQGAYTSKEYRNVFLECGYSQAKIDAKLQNAWDTIFYGGDSSRIYFESGEDEAYILDSGNNDVRSEGMSYGMMICVQMDKQTEFDRLWKWAKTHMQIADGGNQGYFRWSMNTDGTPRSNGPAPDGEEYFALALFFASNRWGDKEEPYNYSEQAKYILRQAIHQEDDGQGSNMWNTQKKLIKFVPDSSFTDPSYHLPHFYELFALWADPEDSEFWKEAAKASREYLKLACHTDTGLAADYATYEGVPVAQNGHDYFASDAFRVAGNIGLDYLWFAEDPWEIEQSNRYQAFFIEEGIGRYYSKYTIDGIAQKEANYQSTGLVAMNAMASLAATGPNAKRLVDDFWLKSPGFGKWRYYDDCLYFFGLLALSGNYRIWE